MYISNSLSWAAGGLLVLSSTFTHTLAAPTARSATVPSLSGSPINIGGSVNGTYPRAVHLNDGSILAAYTVHADSETKITVSRSTDNGATWTAGGIVDSGPTAKRELDNPFPIQLANGRILLAFRNHDKVVGTDDFSYFRITLCDSGDNGNTWTFLSTPVENAGPKFHGLWEPFMRVAGDGSVQIYYSHENNATDQDNLMKTSTDGGATWGAAATISGGNLPAARDGMVGVTSIDGKGNLLAVFESEQNGLFTVNSVTSSDDGKTWGNRGTVYTPTGTGRNAGAPQVVTIGSTLIASFMTDEDNTQGGAWVDKPAAKLVTSGDGGKTWANKLSWSAADSFWPGLLQLDSSSFYGLVAHGAGCILQKITLG